MNGIECEQDLKEIRFCKCSFIKLINLNETSALINVEVCEVKAIDALTETHRPNISWTTLIDNQATFNQYGSTENYESYSFLTVNIESDVGIDLVIKKESNTSYIVAINQWDFHLNEWILCRIPLSKEEELNYQIKHLD